MGGTLVLLVLAAALEIGGDAAIRHGLVRCAWHWVALGAVTLVAYGLMVNANRLIDFGRLMGLYVVVFFVVSRVRCSVSSSSANGRPRASYSAARWWWPGGS